MNEVNKPVVRFFIFSFPENWCFSTYTPLPWQCTVDQNWVKVGPKIEKSLFFGKTFDTECP